MKFNVFVHLASAGEIQLIKEALAKLLQLGEQTMSAITDFAAKQTEHNNRISAALDGLTGDIKTLNDAIAAIQNSPGTLSAEDQAALDKAQAAGEALASKAEALDGITPPTPPVA